MNADSIAVTDDPLGCNLFAYCDNNPIAQIDPTGYCGMWQQWTVGIQGPCSDGTCYAKYEEAVKHFKPYLASKEKPNMPYKKPAKKGSENRQKSGNRERNVGHPNGEEHSIKPKGNRGNKKKGGLLNKSQSALPGYSVVNTGAIVGTTTVFLGTLGLVWLATNDITGFGVADNAAAMPLTQVIKDGFVEIVHSVPSGNVLNYNWGGV